MGNVELIALTGSLFHAQTNGLSLIIEELLPKYEEDPDLQALELARTIQSEKSIIHFSQARLDERVKAMNRSNGIFHNYVDHNGQVDTKVGVGVIDGLPQLAAYIQQGTEDLNNVTSVLICSDGLIWPAGWNESNDESMARLQRMRKQIEQLNLSGYLAELRNAEQADKTCDLYPRFKTHDDATGIYLELF